MAVRLRSPTTSPRATARRPRATGRDLRVHRVRDVARSRFRGGLRAALGRVRPARRDGDARGDPRSARLGSGAAGRARRARLRAARAAARRRDRGAARPHRRGAPRRARPARRRAASWCTSRTPSSSPRTAGTGLAAWLRALPLQTARRCAAAAGCAPGRADRPGRRDGGAGSRPSPRGWPGCARTSAPASGRSIRPPRPTRSRTSARPRCWRAPRPGRCRSRWCCAVSGARTRPRCPRPSSRPSSRRSTRSTACTFRPRRSIRCGPRRPSWTARQPSFRLLPPTRVITAYHHPGFAAPIGDHVMPMRKFQLVADGLAGRAGVRVEAPAPDRGRGPAPRPHARVRRRRAHRRAARARASRRSSRGRRRSGRRCCSPTAARWRRRRARSTTASPPRSRAASTTRTPTTARASAPSTASSSRPRRCARRGGSRRSPCSTSTCTTATAPRRSARRGPGSSTARSTATTTGRTRPTATSRPCATRTAPTTSRSRCRTAAGAPTLLEALERGMAAILACGRPDLVLYQAGADPYREDPYSPLDLDHDDLRERDRTRLRVGEARGAAARLGARGRLHAGPLEGRGGPPWHFDAAAAMLPLSAALRGSGEDRPPPARDLDGHRLRLLLPADRDHGPVLVQPVEAQHRLDRLHARVVRGALARRGARAHAPEQPDRRDGDDRCSRWCSGPRAAGCSTATATGRAACSRPSSSCR